MWIQWHVLTTVPLAPRSIEEFRGIVRDEVLDQLVSDARPLAGARVLHVNATAYGGGVAEILSWLVPLKRDLGFEVDWKVVTGTDAFFGVTKAMHNALQGKQHSWTPEEVSTWVEQNRLNTIAWEPYDFVVIHDPQPAPILGLLKESGPVAGHWLWRCHIDLTDAQPEAWDILCPWVEHYGATIWTMPQYVRKGAPTSNLFVVPPAIDPNSPKNVALPEEEVARVYARFGVDRTRPVMLQVSRFDPWKDPLGVIDAYRVARRTHPQLQLVLVGSMADDDPEGWEWLGLVKNHAGEDPGITILSNLDGVGNVEVNAFQRGATVVVQKSVREGFGLVVTEALWKAKPVVGGDTGGITLQVLDGETGYLVKTVRECGERVAELLDDEGLRDRMGQAGREHVREHFLLTRYLGDYVRMMRHLAGMPLGAS